MTLNLKIATAMFAVGTPSTLDAAKPRKPKFIYFCKSKKYFRDSVFYDVMEFKVKCTPPTARNFNIYIETNVSPRLCGST
jgi:hypothetical protein